MTYGTKHVRRNRGRRTVRGIADRDAAGPQGSPRARGGQGHVSERHDVHPRGSSNGSRGALAVGLVGPRDRRRGVRRSIPTRSTSGHSPSKGRRAPPIPRSRTAPDARCWTRSWSRVRPRPAPRSVRASVSTRFSSRTEPSPVFEDATGGRVRDRSGSRCHRGRWVEVLRCPFRSDRAVQRAPPPAVWLLQLLERLANERPVRDLRPGGQGLRGRTDQ